MNRRTKWLLGWLGLLGLSVVPPAGAVGAGGLGQSLCLPFGLVLALTLTPVDTLSATLASYLPNKREGAASDR